MCQVSSFHSKCNNKKCSPGIYCMPFLQGGGSQSLLENDALSELHEHVGATKWNSMMVTLLGSAWFKLWPETSYPDRFFIVIPTSSVQILGWYLETGHDCLLQFPF
jgi:hypothetical protein